MILRNSAQVFLLSLSFGGFLTSGCNPKDFPIVDDALEAREKKVTEMTEEAIRQSPVLQEIELVCKRIPLPRSFVLVRKTMAQHKKQYLEYGYRSDDAFDSVRSELTDYFINSSWQQIEGTSFGIKSIKFTKDKYYVSIANENVSSGANYSVYCEKIGSNQLVDEDNLLEN